MKHAYTFETGYSLQHKVSTCNTCSRTIQLSISLNNYKNRAVLKLSMMPHQLLDRTADLDVYGSALTYSAHIIW